MSNRFAIAGAAAEASAANTTRSALGAEERQREDQALVYGLQVTPQFIGNDASNPTVGLQNPAIGVLGSAAGEYFAQSAGYQAQANAAGAGLYQGLFGLGSAGALAYGLSGAGGAAAGGAAAATPALLLT